MNSPQNPNNTPGWCDVIELHVTGLPSLDLILGGGIPKGRIIEIYGPESSGKSTLALHILSKSQSEGKKVAYIDAENAFDPVYAERMGVDPKMTFLNQPDSGEQALDIVEKLCQSGKISVIVVDSVACLVPMAVSAKEIDGSMNIATTARLLSQTLPRIGNAARASGTTIIFINQIRMKIGEQTPLRTAIEATNGRFDYKAAFNLQDGSTARMGRAVNAKFRERVLSYDIGKGKVTSSPVKATIRENNDDSWLYFQVNKHQGSGYCKFTCTPNQAIHTPLGLVLAQNLKPGDKVIKLYEGRQNDSPDFADFMVGSLLGDGSMRPSGALRWSHGVKQTEYIQWKETFFEKSTGYFDTKGQYSFDVHANRHIALKYSCFYRGTKSEVLPKNIHELLSPRAVAIWYMDDGSLGGSYGRWGNGKATIPVKSYSEKDIRTLEDALLLRYGIRSTHGRSKTIMISGENAERFFAMVAPFIHPSMSYKIPSKFQVPFVDFKKGHWSDCRGIEPAEIERIERRTVVPKTPMMFSMTVGKAHNFFVDGVLFADGG